MRDVVRVFYRCDTRPAAPADRRRRARAPRAMPMAPSRWGVESDSGDAPTRRRDARGGARARDEDDDDANANSEARRAGTIGAFVARDASQNAREGRRRASGGASLSSVAFAELVMRHGSADSSDGNSSGERETEDETRRAGAATRAGPAPCSSDDSDDEGDGDDGSYYGIDRDGARDSHSSDDDGERDERGEQLVDIYHRLGEHTKSGKERSANVSAARQESASGNASIEGEDSLVVGVSGKIYAEKSFGVFGAENPIRKFCIQLVERHEFDWVVLLIIAANTILLCLSEPERLEGRGCGQFATRGARNDAAERSELTFTILFTLEALLKMIAFGVVGKLNTKNSGAYLRDSWNVMDFGIVIVSVVALLPGDMGSNVSTLRTVRILRPLRTISMFPSLRLLIETMLKSLPLLANVVVFFLLFFCIFGIIGVQFFAGKMRTRCFDVLPPSVPCESYTAQEYVRCIKRASGDAVLLKKNEDQACGTTAQAAWQCPSGQECLDHENPNYGYASFDSVWWSWLVIFQTITLEYWSPVMLDLIDSVSPAVVMWFLPVIFFGSFVILNLALAIVTMVYDANIMDELQRVSSGSFSTFERAIQALSRSESATNDGLGEAVSTSVVRHKRSQTLEWIKTQLVRIKNFVQPRARKFVDGDFFFMVINFSILLNTLVLAMEYDGMSNSYSEALENANLAFTTIFMFELLIKVVALGIPEYVRDRMNWLDAGIVLVSCIELGLNGGEGKSKFTVLRALRVFRILKLMRTWQSLQSTLKTIWKTLVDLSSFLAILCLFVLIFALVGMQLFGGNYCKIDPKPRSNFDTFNNAIITVVQVITHEDWPLVMYDTMFTTAKVALLYFVVVLILGDFIILNSLIAILLSNFDNRKEVLQEQLQESRAAKKQSIFGVFAGMRMTKSDSVRSRESNDSANNEPSQTATRFAHFAHELLKREKRKAAAKVENLRLQRARKMIEEESSAETTSVIMSPKDMQKKQPGALSKVPLTKFEQSSFFGLFKPSHPVRKACFAIADDRRFDWFILMLIIASSITMCWETPENMDNPNFEERAEILDYCFTSAFVVELLMKWIALGMFNADKYSYLKNPWNVLDGTIVFFGLLGMGLGSSADLKWVRALRTLRVLRPLRLLGRVQGLKVVINALIASLPSLVYVLLVSLIVWIIFAIAGMSLFMGKFKSCSDPTILTKSACVDSWSNGTSVRTWDVITSSCNDYTKTTESACTGSYTSAVYVTRDWESADSNFDSFPRAMLTLFETTSGEGWTVTMFNAADAVGTDVAPVRDRTPVATWYFLIFIVLSNFFLFNMCIGIVIDNFLKISTTSLTRTIMSESQARWVAQQRNRNFTARQSFFRRPPHQKWRAKLFQLINDTRFDASIMVIIFINTVVLMTETDHDSSSKKFALDVLNYIFTAAFAVEAMMKIGALYPRRYFSSGWNVFDFIIVVTSILGAILQSGTGSSAFRALRICRVFRMVKKWKSLNTLFQTLVMTIPALGNISLLLALLFFIYAILGTQVFGRLAYGEALNRHANFKTFGNSLSTLLRMLTGEGWQEIMNDCMNKKNCDASFDCAIGTCCGTAVAPVYFVSFVAFSSFIILNLLIAVVLDNYSMSRKEAENENVTPEDVKAFRRVWKKFDPDLTGFVSAIDVKAIILATPKPLGLKGKRVTDLGMLNHVRSLNLQGGSRFLHYTELLQAFTAKAMGVDLNYLPLEIRRELEEDRRNAKRASLLRLRNKVRRRATLVRELSRKEQAADELRGDSFASIREMEIAEEGDENELFDLDGKPISMSVMLVVLKLQRRFRARRARAAASAPDANI